MPFQIPQNHAIPRKRKSTFPHIKPMGGSNAFPRGPIRIHGSGKDVEKPCHRDSLRPARSHRVSTSSSTYYVKHLEWLLGSRTIRSLGSVLTCSSESSGAHSMRWGEFAAREVELLRNCRSMNSSRMWTKSTKQSALTQSTWF
ncbi:hypothetical protein AYL99_07918 [Fonsecaea erecta]|uniref:Uncharacterized protein n=1 Tax=Fonsecaea erecta TaxID=1367422 RepID=A0A178ZBL9_9EURO|nr:hypothetical protein AYL99_07918 [Fonsecaea erecta]OAP57180.1 hypothetical protein AYL99_07918 [Fonsecaea erecta]